MYLRIGHTPVPFWSLRGKKNYFLKKKFNNMTTIFFFKKNINTNLST